MKMRFLPVVLSLLSFIFQLPQLSFCQQEGQLSAEELLFMEVPSVITKITANKTPASVTTITAEDIRITPARNLLDLMEIYVPGALYMAHSDNTGFQPGIRGVISDRTNKLLLLVNGRNMNVNGHAGVETELSNWDMDDIERVEIVRGPGSVTYGPGAVMGVINIITKDAVTGKGVRVGAEYVSGYNSKGIKASAGGGSADKLSYYIHSSVVTTPGIASPRAYRIFRSGTDTYGYWGKDIGGVNKIPSSTYMGDSQPFEAPQIKIHTSFNFLREWNCWARYTQSGVPGSGFGVMNQFANTGPYSDGAAKRNRQVTGVISNNHDFNHTFGLKSQISYMSSDLQAITPASTTLSSDYDNGTNYRWNYSENQLFLKSILSVVFTEKFNAAFGMAFNYSNWGEGWGDDIRNFRMGDGSNIINGPASNVAPNMAGNTPIYAGTGWETKTYSGLAEFNMEFDPKLTAILSGRVDKNSYTGMLYSPRLALISDWDRLGMTKVILQQSVRMNNAEQLWQQNQRGVTSDPETFQGIEFIYTPRPIGNLSLNASVFYNTLEILGWDAPTSSTLLTGKGTLYGTELEGKYTGGHWVLGLNHSFVDLKRWELENNIQGGGFSYSDFRRRVRSGTSPFVTLYGSGQNINDWSKNTTKLFYNQKLFDKKLTVHNDMQIFWRFEGVADQLDTVENATKGTVYDANARADREDAEEKGASALNFKWNFSASYDFNRHISATFFIMNVIPTNYNKRYYYDSTNMGPYAIRVAWIEEPRVFGFKAEYKF